MGAFPFTAGGTTAIRARGERANVQRCYECEQHLKFLLLHPPAHSVRWVEVREDQGHKREKRAYISHRGLTTTLIFGKIPQSTPPWIGKHEILFSVIEHRLSPSATSARWPNFLPRVGNLSFGYSGNDTETQKNFTLHVPWGQSAWVVSLFLVKNEKSFSYCYYQGYKENGSSSSKGSPAEPSSFAISYWNLRISAICRLEKSARRPFGQFLALIQPSR